MTRKKAYWMIAALLLLTVAASNFTPLHMLFKMSVDANRYCYSNLSGTVTVSEDWFKHRVVDDLARFRTVKPECRVPGFEQDTVMHRLFTKQPLAFWRWKEYFTDDRYQLPYASWEEIREGRKSYIDTLSRTPCRDF